MRSRLPVSLDVLLLLVLVPAHSQLSGYPLLLGIPLLFYILLELAFPISSQVSLPAKYGVQRFSFLARLTLLLVMVAGACLIPTLQNINARRLSKDDEAGFSPELAKLQDGALQLELALRYFRNGENPYAANYQDTALRFYQLVGIPSARNPALDYLIYLPGLLLLSFPTYGVFELANLPYDQRWVFLLCYFALILLLPSLAQKPEHKLLLLAAVGLNPLLTGPVIVGMNDVAVILFYVLMAKAQMHQKPLLASFFLAIACTLKQSAWFVIPFFLLYVYMQGDQAHRNAQVLRTSIVLALVMFTVIAPFAVWNPQAFMTDIVLYPAGLVSVNTPIRGYTLGVLLNGVGLLSSPMSNFPFALLQAVFGIPLLAVLLRCQGRTSHIGSVLLYAGVFTFALGFLSRFFHDNYLGYVTVLITMGTLIALSASQERIVGAGEDLGRIAQ